MAYRRYSTKARDHARDLRHHQTEAEALLWRHLRARQLWNAKLRRQQPIGPFIADFCCEEKRLVIEIDGGQHAEAQASDARRTHYLQSAGYRVLRFWNNEVLQQTTAVLERILAALEEPSPQPSPKGRGSAGKHQDHDDGSPLPLGEGQGEGGKR